MPQLPPSHKLSFTIFILCCGYFIDFYDLTIMGVSYNELIQQQFAISDVIKIQQTYLLIANFQTLGIFAGALFFGILGDKIGRVKTISISILLYSIATLLSAYTTSLPWFILLRIIAYAGLACEFATSSTLISELYHPKMANVANGLLYSFGILGGILATSIGFFSWRGMFICGGMAGLILFFFRRKLEESLVFSQNQAQNSGAIGNLRQLFANPAAAKKLIRLLLLNIPYYMLVSLMFIIPNFMYLDQDLAHATKILLFGFFSGNIISCLVGIPINNRLRNYKPLLYVSFCGYLLSLTLYPFVAPNYFFAYSLVLGLIGGAYPVAWIQIVTKSYGTNLRSTASNILFALGRMSGILVNLMLAYWLTSPASFIQNSITMVIVVFSLALIALYQTRNNYSQAVNFND